MELRRIYDTGKIPISTHASRKKHARLSTRLAPRRHQSPSCKGIKATCWQRRFWEHMIRDEADFRAHMDYIHINPVKHGYVERVRDWP